MSLSRILKHIRNSWRVLAIFVVVGLVLGGLATLLQGKTYEAKATVLISPNVPLGSVGPALGADSAFVAQRAQSYVDVATSPRVLKPAAASAGLEKFSSTAVAAEWLVTSPATLTISVTEPSARKAADGANAVATQLISVVDTLERPKDGGNAPVRLSLSNAAEAPSSPASPHLLVNLLLGLLGGLVIGFPVVLAKLMFGSGVSDADALTEATGEPPLAIIGTTRTSDALDLRDAPHSMAAESFRKLRTSASFAHPDAATRSIVVTGPRVGTGATTVACNLALATAEVGQQVVLVDANLREPAVSDLFRLQAGPGLTDVLSGAVELEAALQDGAPNLTVLAAGQGTGEASGVLAGPRMVALLEQLEKQADLVIIDAPAALPYAAAGDLAAIADAALIVARYGKTKVGDLRETRAGLARVGTTVLGVVINCVPSHDTADAGGRS